MLKNDLKMIPSDFKMFPNHLLGQRLGPSGASGIDFGASGIDFRCPKSLQKGSPRAPRASKKSPEGLQEAPFLIKKTSKSVVLSSKFNGSVFSLNSAFHSKKIMKIY